MAKVHANSIDIEYDDLGAACAPVVLLISGLGGQMIRWTRPFCESLAMRGFRVVRFDNRDAGLSTHFSDFPLPEMGALFAALARGERPDIAYTLNDMASDAVGLLDALGIAKAHIVGRSMGGMIGQLIAAEHPERVVSLTSIMSTSGNPADIGHSRRRRPLAALGGRRRYGAEHLRRSVHENPRHGA